jgi:hypothetical protein
MKKLPLTSSFIIILIVTAGCAGCITRMTSTKSGDFGQVSSAGTQSGIQPGTRVNASEIIRIKPDSSYRVEYRTTNTFGGKVNTGTMKLDNAPGDYKGTPAIHFNMTNSHDGVSTITETYYNMPRTAILGETTTWIGINGHIDRTAETSRDLLEKRQVSAEDPTLYTFEGTEPVTVPLGTYATAAKYTAPRGANGTVTRWVVPGIPMPVKEWYRSPEGTEYTKEMISWG